MTLDKARSARLGSVPWRHFLDVLLPSVEQPTLVCLSAPEVRPFHRHVPDELRDLLRTLTEPRDLDALLAGLEAVYAEVQRASGIVVRFARADRKSHQNSHTFYLSYEGPLPAASPKEVKVDITIREQLVRPVEERPVLRGYEEYADLPEDAPVRVYALEEIAVEKLVALTDKARNEPRDLYDLWHLTSEGLIDFSTLIPEVEAKLAFRGRTRDAMTAELATKEARYKKLWAVRLGQQMATLPPFDEVFRAVRRSLRDAGLVER